MNIDRLRNALAVALCGAALGGATVVSADSISAADMPDGRLPSYLIEVPRSVDDILIADAGSESLMRFSRRDNGVTIRDERYMSVGSNGVGKQRAWDRKTPLGIYFITEQLNTDRLAAKYGIAAFVLDYPNAWDTVKERTGYGIWLHGVDPDGPPRPPRDTDGCLALPNDELAAIADELTPHVTPVIIARRLDWSDAREIEKQRLEFRTVLEMWRSSLEQGDLYAHLALYDDTFRARGMDKRQWATFRLGAFDARRLVSVTLDDVLLLRDPEEPDLYLSRFRQTLETDAGPVTTQKRIYWRRSGNDWRIVSEGAG